MVKCSFKIETQATFLPGAFQNIAQQDAAKKCISLHFKCYVLMLVSSVKLLGFVAEILCPFAPCRNCISSLGADDKRVSRAATTSPEMLMLHKDDKGGIPNFRGFFLLQSPCVAMPFTFLLLAVE